MGGIIVDMWSHAFGNFTKVTNKVTVFTTIWKDKNHCCAFEAGWLSYTTMVDIQTWCLLRLKAFAEGLVCLKGRRGPIIDKWSNGGHVKSRLWEFHLGDKQSGCVYYYMERRGLFQAGQKLVWDCLEVWGWKPSYYYEGQVCLKRLACSGPSHGWVCLTGLYWLGRGSGLGGETLSIPSCGKSSQIEIWFAMDKGRCGLVANGKAKAIRESWESAVTELFSASCKQFSLKVVIFVSINWQEELSLKNVGLGDKVELIVRLCRQVSKWQWRWKLAVSFSQSPKSNMIDFLTNSRSRKQQ